MGVVATKNVRNALVYYDNAAATVSGGNRWYDAIGPGVTKYITDFGSLPADDSTTDPTEWVETVVEAGAGTSTATLNDVAGGGLIITTAASEDDGWSMQLGHANAGEWVDLGTTYAYTYFGCHFAIDDVDATDVWLGLAVTDTALLGGVTDSIRFESLDGSTDLNFVIEKDSAESSVAVGTLADNTYVYVEFLHDASAGYVYAYVDGALVTSVADSSTEFPDNELLRLSVEFLTGDDSANNCYIKELRLIHIR